jgi:hypothetical protein
MAQYSPDIPLADDDGADDFPPEADDIEAPINGRHLEDTPVGEHLAATCPACMDEYVFEVVHGETLDYQCECGQVLRVVG